MEKQLSSLKDINQRLECFEKRLRRLEARLCYMPLDDECAEHEQAAAAFNKPAAMPPSAKLLKHQYAVLRSVIQKEFGYMADVYNTEFGQGYRTMIYLGIGYDLIKPFVLADVDKLIAVDLYDGVMSGWVPSDHNHRLATYKAYLTMLGATNILYDTNCGQMDLYMQFMFKGRQRVINLYSRDYIEFYPTVIDQLKYETLIFTHYGAPELKKKHRTYKKYRELITRAPRAYLMHYNNGPVMFRKYAKKIRSFEDDWFCGLLFEEMHQQCVSMAEKLAESALMSSHPDDKVKLYRLSLTSGYRSGK